MEALGINAILLVAQIISFLILFFVFKKFLYPKIQSALEERRNAVGKIYKDKEEVEKRLTNVEKELEQKRKEVAKWTRTVEAEARKAADEVKKEILAKAEAEGEKETLKARERIVREAEVTRQELKSEVVQMTKTIVEKIMEENKDRQAWQKTQLTSSKGRLKAFKPSGNE